MKGVGTGIRMAAPAKINLTLHVGARRSDGFHEVDTLMQAVDLTDSVDVRLTPRGGVGLEVLGPDLGPMQENLAFRAARAFLDAAQADAGAAITLRKSVPAGAGMGGGSSDAAAVLRALNELTDLPFEADELSALGAGLGSDVPFFLGGSPLARGTGRGERVQALRALPERWVVVVVPPVHVATGPAYQALADARDAVPERGCAVGGVVDTGSWETVLRDAHNDFQPVVAALHPAVAGALAALREAGGETVMLSGSGGACFTLFEDEAAARDAGVVAARRLGWPVHVVATLMAFPDPVPMEAAGG